MDFTRASHRPRPGDGVWLVSRGQGAVEPLRSEIHEAARRSAECELVNEKGQTGEEDLLLIEARGVDGKNEYRPLSAHSLDFCDAFDD
jgi:hypothetical protein